MIKSRYQFILRLMGFVALLLFASFLVIAQKNNYVNEDDKKAPFFFRFDAKENPHIDDVEKLIRQKLNKKDVNDKLSLISSETDQKGNIHHRYQQYYKGIKVEHSVVLAHANGTKLNSINGAFPDLPAIQMQARLTKAEALQKVLDLTDATKYKWQDTSAEARLKKNTSDPRATYYPKGELVICKISEPGHSQFGEFVLTYKFDIYAIQPLSRFYFYIDANDGSIVMRDAILKHANTVGTAATRYSGTKAINTEQIGSSYYLHDYTRGSGIETYNLDVNNNISDFIDNDDNWSVAEYNNTAHDNAALDAHFGAIQIYDYWKNVHNRNSYDNNGAKLLSYIHYGKANNIENAFWDGTEMLYGGGANPFTSLDICGHETGHAITQFTSGLVYSFESGALNEGFSDIWGSCIEYYTDPSKQTWLLGEDVYPGNYIRSLSNPNSKFQPDTYLGSYWYDGYGDFGGVHKNSGVLNFWFYLLSTGGNGTNDNADVYSVTGITIDKAANIAYQARFYLIPTSQYPDARNATIQAAVDLYGSGSNEVNQVQNAWFAVGLYANPLIAPTNLAANISVTSINISWNNANSTLTGFIVERSTSPNIGFSTLTTVSSSTLSYVDNSVASDMVYYYRVRAANGTLISPYSNIVSIMLSTIPGILMSNSPQTTCGAVFMDDGGLSNYSDSKNLISTFTPSTSGASIVVKFSSFDLDEQYSYDRILIYDGPNTSSPLFGEYSGNFTPPDNSDVPSSFLYASANNPTGQLTFQFISDANSNIPGWVAYTTCVILPAQATHLVATAASATQTNLTWTDNANNETSYVIERSIDLGNTFVPITILGSNATSYIDSNIPSNAIYQYRIRPELVIASDTFLSKYSNIAVDTLGYIPFSSINISIPGITGSAYDWGDYDNDGDLDLLINGCLNCYTTAYQLVARIYNNNNGNFTDIHAGFTAVWLGDVAWVDYDNDGDLDCLITGGNLTNSYGTWLYRNDKGIFTSVNSGLPGISASAADWGDYDNDGDIDLALIGRISTAKTSNIYNNNNGSFTDINAGLVPSIGDGALYGYSATAKWGDYDNDGDLDLMEGGIVDPLISNAPQINIYQNNNGSFVLGNGGSALVSVASGNWGDYDNDGDLDILASSFEPSTNISHIKIYQNTNGLFSAINISLLGANATFGDYDNDGDLDILCKESNSSSTIGITKIYKNTNGAFFDAYANVLTVFGIPSFADFDNDGDLDILITGGPGGTGIEGAFQLYRNNLIAGSVPLAFNANAAPGAPSGLTCSVTANSATLHWSKAIDSETPQNGLSYSVRIGSTANGFDLLSPPANGANGYRKLVIPGNPHAIDNNNGNYTRNCLSNGVYYWSVQAIDNGYAGSAFAPEQIFTITGSNPSINSFSPANNAFNVSTTTNLVLVFSENIFKGSGFINLKKVSDNSIVESFDLASSPRITISNNTVTIDPSNDLLTAKAYYVEIPNTAFKNSPCQIYFTGSGINTWQFATGKQDQSIIFGQIQSKTFGDSSFALNATATSGLPVSFSSSDPGVAIVQGNLVTIIGQGSTTITASQIGNSNYNPAGNVFQIFIIQNAPLTTTPGVAINPTVTGIPIGCKSIEVKANFTYQFWQDTLYLESNSSVNAVLHKWMIAGKSINLTVAVKYHVSNSDKDRDTITVTLIILDQFGCADTLKRQIKIPEILSIDNPSVNDIKVFPNPFSSQLTIDANLPGHFVLFNLIGQLVYETHLTGNTSFPLNDLSPGVYRYCFIGNTLVKQGKLMKE